MEYVKGEKVKHPKQDAWGLGVVLENPNDDKVRIFFEHVGEKLISTKFVQPIKVAGEQAKSVVLDTLKTNSKLLGITVLVQNFLLKYPEGFRDKLFLTTEVKTKQKVADYAQKHLNQEQFAHYLEESNYPEITKVLRHLIEQDTFNIIDTFDKSVFLEHLETPAFQVDLADNLYNLLYGEESEFNENFILLVDVLKEMKSAHWTLLSYFLFIFFPKKYCVVKPTITQNIAKVCEFNVLYEPLPNPVTYEKVMKLTANLIKVLIDLGLKPKNMIDIQSFMWVVEKH